MILVRFFCLVLGFLYLFSLRKIYKQQVMSKTFRANIASFNSTVKNSQLFLVEGMTSYRRLDIVI